ncbi:MAG TPA: lipopolysaccharide kinase [Planctomycetes bacterium]|nr:lipopolysaccharide kinase [Planctomycetota bacterium]
MDWIDDQIWVEALRARGWTDFDSLWRADLPDVEEPNRRRGGWSRVGRLVLAGTPGRTVFLKRQENHRIRSFRHPFRGESTCAREWRNLVALRRVGFPVPRPIAFGERIRNGALQALLLLEEVPRARSLDRWIEEWEKSGWPPPRELHAAIDAVAAVVGRLHRLGYRQGALYPKHVFLERTDDGVWRVSLIDMEKSRLTCLRARARLRDLDAFNRRTPGFTRSQRWRFLRGYGSGTSQDVRRLFGKLARRAARRVRGGSVS